MYRNDFSFFRNNNNAMKYYLQCHLFQLHFMETKTPNNLAIAIAVKDRGREAGIWNNVKSDCKRQGEKEKLMFFVFLVRSNE